MKRKTGLSVMMALLMVFSVFTVITPSVTAVSESYIEVTKEVWDPDAEKWVNYIYAEYGDTVQFRIIVTYYNSSGGDCASCIVVTDTLPAGLEYVETISVEPDYEYELEVFGNTLVWDFAGTGLADGQSITIIFDALVVGGTGNYGENVNTVNVTAKECAGNKELSGSATATVYIESSVDVDKEVWDPDAQEWVEHLDSVIKDVDVRFRIVVTYHGDITMKCMKVIDFFLPEDEEYCLEYADNVYIEIDGEIITEGDPRYPEITVTEHCILWDWRNVTFTLYDGESVIIKFDANVTDYCYDECTITNRVFAHLWGCYGCTPDNHVWDCDTATVDCRPHDSIFEKKVWNGKEWAEETKTYVGEKVKFRLTLTYFGDYNLTDIKIVDYLPEDILEYTDTTSFYAPLTIPIEWGVEYSEDKKTIWWNTTAALNDSETLIIEFYAKVIGSTGDCEECGNNVAGFSAIESVTEDPKSGEDTAKVIAGGEISICINMKQFGIGRIYANIFNIGDEDLKDVEWTIKVRGSVLKRITVSKSGTVNLPGNSGTTVSLPQRSILRKFGGITGTVTVTVPGSEPIEEGFKGFVIGRIVIIRPLIRILR